jgi:2-amino-4-hydroxy-6-hydroxymethyldihydropteridine diphosphokinase
VSVRTNALLSVGANLGDRAKSIHAALEAIGHLALHPPVVSDWYESAPMYVEDQPAFYNLAVAVTVATDPRTLMRALLEIERALGRERGVRFGPRAMDLDVIAVGPWVYAEPELTIPHPRMLERPFVLVPAAEVAPTWRHPLVGATLAELAAELNPDARATIRRVTTPEPAR